MSQAAENDLFPDAPVDLDRVPVDAELRARWPQALIDMHAVIEHALANLPGAADRATDVTRALAKYFGGVQWYLPQGEQLEIALRDRTIWRKFNGRNAHLLALEYKLSQQQIYTVCERQRQLHLKKIQPDLFAAKK